MNYEQKYKEALERAKTLYENANGMILKKWVEQVFPELCESEDERIRNRLIDYFYGFLDGFEDTYKVGGHVKWEGLDVKNVIAWLENIPYTIDHEKREGFHLGYKAGLESQGEQNVSVAEFKAKELDAEKKELKSIFDVEIPYGAKDSELQEVCYYIPEGFHAEIEGNRVVIKRGEQNPWDEKDENMVKTISDSLNTYTEKAHPYLKSVVKDEINWLKSLKYRVLPQPKQDWSEEDEDMRYKATSVIHRLCAEGKEYVWSINTLEKLFCWLKSIKPQNTWKPNDEQIYWLKWAIDRMPDTEKANEAEAVLEELLEQLKKLKE